MVQKGLMAPPADRIGVQRKAGGPISHTAGSCLPSAQTVSRASPRPRADGDLGLINEAAKGRTANAIRGMQLESDMRGNPALRADVFVQRWQTLDRQRRSFMRDYENTSANRVADRMIGLAKSLERDPQVESILRNRKSQLGRPERAGQSIGQSLADMVGRGRSRGPEIGM